MWNIEIIKENIINIRGQGRKKRFIRMNSKSLKIDWGCHLLKMFPQWSWVVRSLLEAVNAHCVRDQLYQTSALGRAVKQCTCVSESGQQPLVQIQILRGVLMVSGNVGDVGRATIYTLIAAARCSLTSVSPLPLMTHRILHNILAKQCQWLHICRAIHAL